MKDRSKCVVLVPIASVLEPQTDAALRVLANRGYKVQTLLGSSQVDLARSTLATDALVAGFDETLWIDADMDFYPDDVDRIRKLNLPFVAATYSCKGPKRLAGKFRAGQGQVTFGRGGSVVEVEYVGMGFTYVRREVYEKIANDLLLPACGGGYEGRRVVPFFIPALTTVSAPSTLPDYLSEDYSFSLRARMAGFPPLVDTRIKVGHVGKKTYTWDDLTPDACLESVIVEQLPQGIVIVGATEETKQMLNRADLLAEQAHLEQQLAQCNDGIAAADKVKQDNLDRKQAMQGAQQMITHLLSKCGEINKPCTGTIELPAGGTVETDCNGKVTKVSATDSPE